MEVAERDIQEELRRGTSDFRPPTSKIAKVVLILTIAGCAGITTYQYQFQPLSVPDQAEALGVGVIPSVRGVHLFIDNQSDKVLQVLWDRCVYVDIEGFSHRLIRSGTKFIAKEQPQPPTTLAPHSRLEDALMPSDYVEWGYSQWETRPLFPSVYFSGTENPGNYKGKEFSIMIMLDIDGTVVERLFKFQIADVVPAS
jgi:hypothetical protein